MNSDNINRDEVADTSKSVVPKSNAVQSNTQLKTTKLATSVAAKRLLFSWNELDDVSDTDTFINTHLLIAHIKLECMLCQQYNAIHKSCAVKLKFVVLCTKYNVCFV